MELQAAIIALSVLPSGCRVKIVLDSRYVVNGASTWAGSRQRKMLRRRKPVPNADLWQKLDAQQSTRVVAWEWVRGHDGHAENEIADRLAARGLRSALPNLAPAS
jgi:ribonuclease HI